MEKIIVTEEQAKIIKNVTTGCSSKAYRVVNISKQVDLDLITIAQIVEGYPYEIKRDFKVGDIVFSKNACLYHITKTNQGSDSITLEEMKQTSNLEFKLVCKAENREDLAHG